jgi:TonB family protein
MASTEIPPRKPFLPPPLYSAGRGASVEPLPRPGSAAVPVPKFLISLQDELERSHRREAFWMSVLVHLVALVAFVNGAKLFPKRRILVPTKTEILQHHEYTFLVLPPDLQKNVPQPHTSILSDKNRVATSRQPVIDRRVLQHILAGGSKGTASAKVHQLQPKFSPPINPVKPAPQARTEVAAAVPPALIRAGEPEMASVPAATPAPALPASAQPASGPTAGTPPATAESTGGGTAENGINAAQTQAASRSNVDVLSDTMGVDFGPYLSRVLRAVRVNWFNRIPESARAPLMKKGKVSIQFDILKTGQIAAMEVVGTSGDPSLDGAAIGGINQSGPFPPLPPQFQGQYLALRFHFFYNPDNNDLRFGK